LLLGYRLTIRNTVMESRVRGYDIVGDIHGHAEELRHLLVRLGYRRSGYGFRHDERQVVFVGDFFDRGPQIAEAVQIARATVEDGNGHAVIGNHEFNAIAFHTRHPDGKGFFRPRTSQNQHQHQATLDQLSSLEMRDAIDWFKTLPSALELGGFRVVHASWQPADIEVIESACDKFGRFTTEFLAHACNSGTPLHQAIENVLKGPEIKLPDGESFLDKDGHERFSVRVRWYADRAGMTLQDYSIGAGDNLSDEPVPSACNRGIEAYPDSAPPVFFGHYWLQSDPEPFASNVACVDYSVAKQGKLCAYQWNVGDTEISLDQFVWVAAQN
jgi:hypothetical protein